MLVWSLACFALGLRETESDLELKIDGIWLGWTVALKGTCTILGHFISFGPSVCVSASLLLRYLLP